MGSTTLNKAERSSNIELYRIIVMLLIVAHHSIVNSGVMESVCLTSLSAKSTFAYLFGLWGKTGINCFVMITGYFMCQSSISLRKWMKLLLEVVFYNIVISGIFWVTGYAPFTIKGLYSSFLPVKNMSDDFISAFIVFYPCIPFLNKLIHSLTAKQHLRLIILSLAIYTLPLFLPLVKISLVYVTWFCIIFFIASFIRLYPELIPYRTSSSFWRNITLVLVGITSILAVVFVQFLPQHDVSLAFRLVSDSNAFLAICIAVSSFMWFKNMKIKHSQCINTIATSTFGVLCIHANSDTMRQWLWFDRFNINEMFILNGGGYFAIKLVVIVLTVFAICVVIDYFRIMFVEVSLFCYLDKKFSCKTYW